MAKNALTPGAEFAISTFGHGPHQCPGKRFAIHAAKTIVASLLARVDVRPGYQSLRIIPTSMGAVGRPVEPAVILYTKKAQHIV